MAHGQLQISFRDVLLILKMVLKLPFLPALRSVPEPLCMFAHIIIQG